MSSNVLYGFVGADLRVCPRMQGEHIGSPLQTQKNIPPFAKGGVFLYLRKNDSFKNY